jgi:leucyl/phenylalanyl-tRNA--protein transferase
MADPSGEVGWYTVRARAVFPVTGIHVSRSLARKLRRGGFETTFDRDFEAVVRGCFRPEGNWLTEEFVRVYTEAHREGWGHSCEVWMDGALAGGIYGLAIGKVFSAESMFHRRTDASKIALWAMVERCRALGFEVFDAQVMNRHLASLGAYLVPEDEYLRLLESLRDQTTPWSQRRA